VNEHPTGYELRELLGGRLPQTRERSAMLHLLLCQECRTIVKPELSPLLSTDFPESPAEELPPELDMAYDMAIDRAVTSVLERRRGERERSGVKRALAIYDHEGLDGLRAEPGLLRGLAAYRSLLEMCQELRYEDPKRMVDVAALAVYAAGRLSVRRFGAERVADWKCRALIELANAYRVADRLDEAESSLGEATEAFQAGSHDELLEARLYDVRASLLADRRLFAKAGEALDTVQAIYQRRGDRHLAGRALISKGVYVGYSGSSEEAVRLLREGLSLVDAQRDPTLFYGAVHNQAHFLLTSGRLREARSLLFKHPVPPEAVAGRMNLLKIRWLAAQIDAALGDLVRAGQGFREVKQGFEEEGLYYKAALVALELATVWLRQGRHEEAQAQVVEVLGVFKVLRIPREALGSLLLLDRAFEEQQAATGAMVEAVIELLKRIEDNPSLAFETGGPALAATLP
jgi:tetratricopeptide (TPR) repeat protein